MAGALNLQFADVFHATARSGEDRLVVENFRLPAGVGPGMPVAGHRDLGGLASPSSLSSGAAGSTSYEGIPSGLNVALTDETIPITSRDALNFPIVVVQLKFFSNQQKLHLSPKSHAAKLAPDYGTFNRLAVVTTQNFVGPDGKVYSVNEPEEGGFFIHRDPKSWLITFPVGKESPKHRYFCGETLPTSANEWRSRDLGTRNPFPNYVA